jgi:predicted DNA-binding transcriptional regulator YafY
MADGTMNTEQEVRIFYTNWRGETRWRRVVPIRIWFGSNPWHPEPQWLLDAFDVDKAEDRAFAMKNITDWWDRKKPT